MAQWPLHGFKPWPHIMFHGLGMYMIHAMYRYSTLYIQTRICPWEFPAFPWGIDILDYCLFWMAGRIFMKIVGAVMYKNQRRLEFKTVRRSAAVSAQRGRFLLFFPLIRHSDSWPEIWWKWWWWWYQFLTTLDSTLSGTDFTEDYNWDVITD